MTVELTPLGIACNLKCTYCYQQPMRDAGNVSYKREYDLAKMFAALEREGSDFLVFGGEPLLVPIQDLETIFAFGLQRFNKNGIQTNGVLITDRHIDLFKKYKVHVGFSLDGPEELNDSRWQGTLENTRESTQKSFDNLQACLTQGVPASIIITLYRGNALPDRLSKLKEWIKWLDANGIRGIRIHLLEVDHPVVRQKMQLTTEETIVALEELLDLDQQLEHVKLDIVSDMKKLLLGDDDNVTCIWNPCDPYTTSAVRGIDGQGNLSNCGRTNKDGIPRVKADRPGFHRQLALFNTPQEHGGCQGCRFFAMCKGQCPGTAIDGDWRNRSADCPIWFHLFEILERVLLSQGRRPVSQREDRAQIEQVMLNAWASGQHMSIKRAIQTLKYGDAQTSMSNRDHADSPHGDQHGDHTDHSAIGIDGASRR